MNLDFQKKSYHKRFPKDGIIRCIFFCEFHHTAGPIISCQVPENYISKELFDSISVYIITKPELQRSTITVTLENYKVLGFPIRIDNKNYKRNAFHFNLCFVCDSDARTVQYEHVVTKFSEYLMAMEIESRFLSTGNSNQKLAPILRQVLDDLNTKGECALTEGPIATHLKVCQIRSDPIPVLDHQVPVFIKQLPSHQSDLTTQQVTPYIDGFNHIARIAALSTVDNNLVKACVQNLAYYGVVALVPLFQYGNVYCSTPKLRTLAHDLELQKRCLNYVCRSHRQPPNLRDVFRMFSAMSRGTTIRDLCSRYNMANLRINERKLVQFGVLEGLITRIQKYPIFVGEPSDLEKSFTGSCSVDEICCATGVTAHQLEDRLERDNNVVLLCK
ncbi:GATOR complex protein NPRL2 isoform X2 [Anthonomus grandis grandis]|uniref:GATOR complex protein NPRL2 isoform X2 n=1 Tax=Anthonomus grandis grandis TaxID=2921223 RepID=UPI0021656CD3|nr:GATOR complex protein NPRL2 isoform X2 [Anthonomus grandis grandis]